MKTKLLISMIISIFALGLQAATFHGTSHNWNSSAKKSGKPVNIDKGIMNVAGISRNQDSNANVHPAFAKTSRPCPPFCIQPMYPFAPAKIETVGEREMIDAAQRVANGDTSVLLMDNRTPVWTTAARGGTIPHSVNIPFNTINNQAIAKDPDAVIEIITQNFDVEEQDGILDFSNAKTLYMFCNGMWCGQSPAGIRALLKLGYPESKLKYYRGGMQDWHILGLSTTSSK